ncbi:MAG: NTP transferase domain-containing protein [Humibacillus sp.]|nr:NTP transferase domain-containing protein [Humibacillus sp.]MDN5776561.1 NTP transferase domain-containing protein [Humibacillus sp.]
MPRTRVVIQSRLNSSRLPGKALLTIGGMPLVELVARRAARSGHEVVVATSAERYDDRIAAHLASVGIPVVRGSLDDVLARFVQATDDLDDADRVVRLTGDNPVADSDLVEDLMAAMAASGHRYGRIDIDQVPEGLGAEVFLAADLRRAALEATDPYDREHVTPWLRRTLGELLHVPAGSPNDVRAYRATVDTLSDYVRVSALFDGVADPVAVPWQRLMSELSLHVDAVGTQVPVIETSVGLVSRVVLSSRHFTDPPDGTGPAAWTEHLRTLLARAIDRGVTHVDTGLHPVSSQGSGSAVGPEPVDLLRATGDPALTKRYSVVCRAMPAAEGPGDVRRSRQGLEVVVERTLAGLGRRGPVVLVIPAGSTPATWDRARGYLAEGVASSLGVLVAHGSDLQRPVFTDDVRWVEVDPSSVTLTVEQEQVLAGLASRGAVVAIPWRRTDPPPAPWVTCVLVTEPDADAVGQAVSLFAG